MLSAVSVLLKIVAKGFYKEHAGLLIFLFVTFISYFFFIQILNPHIRPEEVVLYNLILGITFISSPAVTLFICSFWLIYAIKCWTYVKDQLDTDSNQFLRYSLTAFSKSNQFKLWLIVQTILLLPLVGYSVFALILGLIFKYYFIPLMILGYLSILIGLGAWKYVWYANKMREASQLTFINRVLRKWPKPQFSLFLYYLPEKLQLNFVLTKILSISVIVALLSLLHAYTTDSRLAGLLALSVVVTQAVLIFHAHTFEEKYLSMMRNLPLKRSNHFLNNALCYMFILLPEAILILFIFGLIKGVMLLSFSITTMLLMHSILYISDIAMKLYMKLVFALFVVFFILIMFNLIAPLTVLNLITAYLIFYHLYYRKEFNLKIK